MTCSHCGGTVDVAHMRCGQCHVDVLSEDMVRRPVPRSLTLGRATSALHHVVDAFEAVSQTAARAVTPLSIEERARVVELNARMRRDRWRVVLVPVCVFVYVGLAWLIQR